jgi:hypothetical protein
MFQRLKDAIAMNSRLTFVAFLWSFTWHDDVKDLFYLSRRIGEIDSPESFPQVASSRKIV